MLMASTSNTQSLNTIDDGEDYKRILRLLQAKVHGDPLPSDANVHECDLYGEKNPWEIWELFGGGKDGSRELYFFTTIRMDMRSGDVVRTIGSGSWEDQHNNGAIVCTETKRHLARKKCFLFGKSGTSHDRAWIMREYFLVSSDLLTRPVPLLRKPPSNYSHVLCKLIKNQGRIRVRRMNQQTGVTITLPFPANPPSSTNNKGSLRLTEIGSVQFQAEGVDKRITLEETTAEERPVNTENRTVQQLVGDMLNSMEEHDARGGTLPLDSELLERFDK